MSSRKWYEYFVSVEGGQTMPPGASGPPPPGGDAANEIARIAAGMQQVPAPPPPPAKLEIAAAGAAATGLGASFEEIYAMAEIPQPAQGYTVFKIADMLNSEHIRQLPAEVKRGSVLVALDAAGVKVQDVIQDAIRRDQALDAFERVRVKSVDDLEARKLEENKKIQADLDAYVAEQRARLQANLDEIAKQKESLSAWRFQKQQEEQRIADCVSYFVTENPISTTTNPNPRPAGTEPKPGI